MSQGERSASRRRVAFGFLGTRLDGGRGPKRWERWRPTVALCSAEDFAVDRLELLFDASARSLVELVTEDIGAVSPRTTVVAREMKIEDPWDFEEVFGVLHDLALGYPFDTEEEEYLLHITTGTHVAQICWFLLAESRHFPAQLVQTSPSAGSSSDVVGSMRIIDLDLSRYDRLAARFAEEHREGGSLLKSGIETRNEEFNHRIQRIEQVSLVSTAPVLLQGPTGAGKTRLAGKIYELRQRRRLVDGPFVEVNCATLRGDGAMSTLFGHRRGAFTGAVESRGGLLRRADGGVLFLDEVGELGLDEQAMLLRAMETGRFLPVGEDREVESNFQLIAGTNTDLGHAAKNGKFREDLLARINLWTFHLPGLAERPEDIAPNVDFELEQFRTRTGTTVRFNREARKRYLGFATGPEGLWPDNFRGLNASITRMATLAAGGRIDLSLVEEELRRLRQHWGALTNSTQREEQEVFKGLLEPESVAAIDPFDRVQLAYVVETCRRCSTLSEAGRHLFSESRKARKSRNDSDRLRKYLAKFGLEFSEL